jgi:hypothetical protein
LVAAILEGLLARHNIDMMHLENNFFNNMFHTLLDTDKTKDNAKAREDMAKVCNRPGLELRRNSAGKLEKPSASYCLTKEDKKSLCEWARNLRFPDGYASNLSNSVNLFDNEFEMQCFSFITIGRSTSKNNFTNH